MIFRAITWFLHLVKTWNDPLYINGFTIFYMWSFFSRRFQFFWTNFHKREGNIFKFRLLLYTVVAMRGEEARKSFFDNKNLDPDEGYHILRGDGPDLKDVSEELKTDKNIVVFNKRMTTMLLNTNRLADIFPCMMNDLNERMLGWGEEGLFNPFRNIFDLVFQMTVRISTCDELARDYGDMGILQENYTALMDSYTLVGLLLPWFPSPTRRKKVDATTALYRIVKKYVDMRRAADTPSSDAIDVLLSNGEQENEIIGLILSVIYNGKANASIIASWSLLYLAFSPEWRGKAEKEINELIAKHTDFISSEPLYKRLSVIPISAWEDEMPVVDAIIRETMRLIITGTALRRNVGEDIIVDGHRVKKGDFFLYSLYDVHMNEEIYENPKEFDPGRYDPGRQEDRKSTYAFLGWGAGRHPCPGMRFAKLELKALIALFLSEFEYKVVNAFGIELEGAPQKDYDDMDCIRHGEPCFFKYQRKSSRVY